MDGREPTNNRAERALRGPMLWRKSSFGYQSEIGRYFLGTLAYGSGHLPLTGTEFLGVPAAELKLLAGEVRPLVANSGMDNTQDDPRDRTLDEARRNDHQHRKQVLKRTQRAYQLWDEVQAWIGWTLALTVPCAFVYTCVGYWWCGLAWITCFVLFHLLHLVKDWLVARIAERL